MRNAKTAILLLTQSTLSLSYPKDRKQTLPIYIIKYITIVISMNYVLSNVLRIIMVSALIYNWVIPYLKWAIKQHSLLLQSFDAIYWVIQSLLFILLLYATLHYLSNIDLDIEVWPLLLEQLLSILSLLQIHYSYPYLLMRGDQPTFNNRNEFNIKSSKETITTISINHSINTNH